MANKGKFPPSALRSSLLFVNAWHNWWKQKFALCCAIWHKKEHDLATVGTSKENRCLRVFGWNRNWLIPWECGRDPIYSSYFGEKNRKVSRKHRHWVTLLNNSVTQWWPFHRTLAFFRMFALKKWNFLAHQRTPIFFSTNKRSFAPFCSVLRCSFGCGATLRSWWKHTLMYRHICTSTLKYNYRKKNYEFQS